MPSYLREPVNLTENSEDELVKSVWSREQWILKEMDNPCSVTLL